ncbi:helix-turn-helix domain-containing protein [Enterococcus sp. DIV0170]|uniref:helix-turn-helix domain-containing protein n=1 Tax=Enterococcus sp. DIV0170 TaxID=2774642 RepID=UPI003F217894
MVLIKEVFYFNTNNPVKRTISHFGPSLIIQLQKKQEITSKKVSFYLNKSDYEGLIISNNDVDIIEILLNLAMEPKSYKTILTPLKATKEMQQIAYLLFSYYLYKIVDYSVDQVILLLVNRVLKVNAHAFVTDHNFLKLVKYMEENINKNLKIIDFCSNVHMSEASLNRMCKEQAGVPPMLLFRKIQCNEAERLMRETSFKIREISEILGFKNSSHFSMMFHKVVGMSPLHKRKSIGGVQVCKLEKKN